MEKLRIFHISPLLGGGGVGNVSLAITKELSELGHEVILATPKPIKIDIMDKILYQKLKDVSLSEPVFSPLFVYRNKSIIQSAIDYHKPDLILTHGPFCLFSIFLKKEVPCFSIIHGTYFNEVRFMYKYPLFGIEKIKYLSSIWTTHLISSYIYRKIFNNKNNVYALPVSKNTGKELIELGVDSAKIMPILNGVDKSIFRPLDKQSTKIRFGKIYNSDLNGKILLHVNPAPRKGTHVLIKALDLLRKYYLDDRIILIIVGKIIHKSYLNYLQKLVSSLGLEKNIILTSYVKDEMLPIVYNIADVTVVPSYSEGSPLVIPESISCGTPVVATNVGGNVEYALKCGLEKYIVDLQSSEFQDLLANSILKILNDKIKVRPEYIPSWLEVCKDIINIFKKIY